MAARLVLRIVSIVVILSGILPPAKGQMSRYAACQTLCGGAGGGDGYEGGDYSEEELPEWMKSPFNQLQGRSKDCPQNKKRIVEGNGQVSCAPKCCRGCTLARNSRYEYKCIARSWLWGGLEDLEAWIRG